MYVYYILDLPESSTHYVGIYVNCKINKKTIARIYVMLVHSE